MTEHFYSPLHNIEISPIVRIAEKARTLEHEYEASTGQKFIHLERGELNLATPTALVEEIKSALDAGKTKYPKSGGELPFREKIAEKLRTKNNIPDVKKEEIIVTMGGQEALNMAFNLFNQKVGAGFAPIWSVAVENFVTYSAIQFLEIPLNEDFSINWDTFEETIKRVAFFYLNNPQNPSGKVFTADEQRRIAEICAKYKVFIISDEAYEDIIYDGRKHVSLASVTDYPEIISAYTFSKSFAATGIRVGYAYSKNPVVTKLFNGMQYSHTAGVPTFLQYGLMHFNDIDLSPMLNEFQARRDLFYNGLMEVPGVKVIKPEGAFYLYPDISEGMKKHQEDVLDFLMKNGLCVVPGWGFTKHGHFLTNVRISFSAITKEEVRLAVDRFKQIF